MKPVEVGEGNVAVRWAKAAIEALVRNGVKDVVVSPGSRSTPLVAAVSDHPRLRDLSVVDERSAAFVAIGLAAATGRPVALVCTSGTAAANYFPAICEADRAGLPLVVCTADRPPSLRDSGASQTMRQVGLYGDKVRYAHDVALPSDRPEDLRYVAAVVSRATGIARSEGGPVHLNFPFAKPLEPQPSAAASIPERSSPPLYSPAVAMPDPLFVTDLVGELERSVRPVIYVGSSTRTREFETLLFDVADRLGAPVVAEATSGLRFGSWSERVINADVFLSNPRIAEALQPDLIIRVGKPPLNWPTSKWEAAISGLRVVVARDWESDPGHAASHYFVCDERSFFDALRRRLPAGRGSGSWVTRLQSLSDQAEAHARVALDAEDELFDGAVAFEVAQNVMSGGALVVSSSMPLRELETFGQRRAEEIRVFCNRGLNGIDGVISTAIGVSQSGDEPTVCLIGDVAFSHDIGALAAAVRVESNLTLVVVDNGGGAIFDHLPVAGMQPMYDRHFVTAQTLDYAACAATFGARCAPVDDRKGLVEALRAAQGRPGVDIIVARTSREGARAARQRITTSFVPTEG